MDGHQQLELVNTDRSCWSRSHSRLSSALQYAESRKSTSRPSSTASAKVNVSPQAQGLDRTPEMGSALSSPEPSLFSVVNRTGISSPFAYKPLPPIKTLQKDQELKEKVNSKEYSEIRAGTALTTRADLEKEFQIRRKIREEERQRVVKERTERGLQVILPHEMKLLAEKHGMESGLKTGSLVTAKDSMISKLNNPIVHRSGNETTKTVRDYQESRGVTEFQKDKKTDLPSSRKVTQQKDLASAPKAQKPLSQPKCHIVVRETKASRLRKKLQMEKGQVDKTLKALPHMKAQAKLPTQTSMTKTHQRMSRSPSYHSRSSSESLPPTPSDPGPPRPDCVSGLDLSFLSPDDYPKGAPISPPQLIVRETKASRLRRLKLLEDEKEAKRREGSERLKDMAFHQPHEKFRRKKSPPPLKPAPPKPYKKPASVMIKETISSQLCKQGEIKEIGSDHQIKENRIVDGSEQTSRQRRDVELGHQPTSTKANDTRSSKSHQLQDREKIRNGRKQSETPMVSCELPQISCSRTDNTLKNEREQTPREIVGKFNQLSSNVPINQQAEESSYPQSGKRILGNSSPAHSGPVSNPISTSCKVESPHTISTPNTTSRIEKQNKEQEKKVSGSTSNHNGTSRERNFKIARRENQSNNNPKRKEESPRRNSTPQSEMEGKRQVSKSNIEEQRAERGQETQDKSARNRMFRMEMARGLKVRKEIRSAMEEDEERWKKDLLKEFEEIEGPYVFGKPEDNNKHIVTEALSILRERLEELEATDNNTAKSKVNSYFRKKLKIFFKKKEKALKDEQEDENMKKEKEEKIDEYFRRTVKSINGVLSDVWERFINQQDGYQEMLKKITLQEEMLEKWKSDARHYRFMHTMLKKDYLEGRMESWYLNKDSEP